MSRVLIFVLFIFFQACIGDDIIEDFVEPEIRITNPIDSLELDASYQFEFTYFNNVGRVQNVTADWLSTDESIISITSDGLANALQAGQARIQVSYSDGSNTSMDEINVTVGDNTSSNDQKSGTINTTSSYALNGDFTITQQGDDLFIEIASNWVASSSLPGLYVYLSNNPNSIADAQEIGPVTVFSGAHSYTVQGTGINDFSYLLYFCKPFNVKVGHGEIK